MDTQVVTLQCRAEIVKDEFLDAVEKQNAAGGNVVLEFGLQTIHRNEQRCIDRPNNRKRVDRVLHDCKRRGI